MEMATDFFFHFLYEELHFVNSFVSKLYFANELALHFEVAFLGVLCLLLGGLS